MGVIAAYLVVGLLAAGEPLGPGDHTRVLKLDESTRSYVVHVPPKCDPQQPVPVVLALHGAAMNGPMMAVFSGLNDKADEAGFVAVFPNGTGVAGLLLTWNAGGLRVPRQVDRRHLGQRPDLGVLPETPQEVRRDGGRRPRKAACRE